VAQLYPQALGFLFVANKLHVSGGAMCPQNCLVAAAVVLSPVCTVLLGNGSTCHNINNTTCMRR
jgi:hypothetical protein